MDGGMSLRAGASGGARIREHRHRSAHRELTIDLARQHIAALDRLPRPTLVTCRAGPRSSTLVYLYAGLRSRHVGRGRTLAHADASDAPFAGSRGTTGVRGAGGGPAHRDTVKWQDSAGGNVVATPPRRPRSVSGMVQLRPACGELDAELPPRHRPEAMICSFECTFCRDCVVRLDNVCPNCGGGFCPRPIRPGQELEGRQLARHLSGSHGSAAPSGRRRGPPGAARPRRFPVS